MNITQRLAAPTPRFFKQIRKWGLIIAGIGGTILAAPIAVPAALVSIAGYCTLAGAVASAVSQAATVNDASTEKDDGHTG